MALGTHIPGYVILITDAFTLQLAAANRRKYPCGCLMLVGRDALNHSWSNLSFIGTSLS